MKNRLLAAVEAAQVKSEVAKFQIGDTVDVHQVILDDKGKSRTQIFSGVVIARRGEGMGEMFTVRRVVQSEGVERTWPIHSPKISKIEVKREGKVRRAKLFYLRDRVGKATRLKERKAKGEAATQAVKVPKTRVAARKRAEAKAKAEAN